MTKRIIRGLCVLLILAPAVSRAESFKIPDLGKSSMSIPWSDFKELLERLQEAEKPTPEKPPPKPPADYSLTSAQYQGKLEEGAVAFTATIKLTALVDDKWLKVAVLPEGLALSEIKVDGEPALIKTENGWHRVMIMGAGDRVVTCRFYVSYSNQLGPRTVSFSMPRAPVTALDFTIGEPDLEIKAEPASLNRMSWADGASSLSAVLPATGNVRISWFRKIEVAEAELRVNAEIETLVSLGERLCKVDTVINYEILHQGVTELKLGLPENVTVVDVSGTGLADWRTERGDDRQVLTASLSYEAKGRYALFVSYETTLPDATAEVEVPKIEALDVNRVVGNIGVAARTNIEVEVKQTEKLASIDVAQLPIGIASRSAAALIHAFKHVGAEWKLVLQTTKHQDVAMLTCASEKLFLHSFLSEEGELLTRAVWSVRNNQEQFMRVTLPKDARVLSTFSSDRPIKPAWDGKRLLLPLQKTVGASGKALSFTVEVTYLVELDQLTKQGGNMKLEAPKSDVMTEAMEWRLYLPPDYRYKIEKSSFATMAAKTSLPTSKYMEQQSGTRQRGDDARAIVGKNGKQVQVFNDENRRTEYDLNNGIDNVNKDNEQVLANDPFYKEGSKKNYLAFLTAGQQGGSDDAMGAPVKAVLPVSFAVPESELWLEFTKSIIKSGEANEIEFKYKKPWLPKRRLPWTKIVIISLAIALVVVLLVRRRRRKKREAEARTEGAS